MATACLSMENLGQGLFGVQLEVYFLHDKYRKLYEHECIS